MTQEEWMQECNTVKQLMINHVARLPTPISMSKQYGIGVAWGTGNYVNLNDKCYLLTNEHVFSECPPNATLAHLPVNNGDYIAIVNQPCLIPYPIDVGVSELANSCYATDRVIYNQQMDQEFSAVERELVFWTGFPGYKAQRNEAATEVRLKTNLFEPELKTDAQSFLTQIAILDDVKIKHYDPIKHIAIHYPAMAYNDATVNSHHCANPKGMSGSLLWDTKYIACRNEGRKWNTKYARVCGVIWAAHEHPLEIVVATKIEYILETLYSKLTKTDA